MLKTTPPYAFRKRFCLAFCAVILCTFSLVLQAQTAVVNGEEIYRNYCSVCHGDQGDGMTRVRRGLNPPPRDFTTKVAKVELSEQRMINSVTHGRPDTAMMPFDTRLNAEEVQAVVAYIRTNFMHQGEVQVDARMLTLDQGKNIYVSNCAVCHGDDGNGAMWTKTSLNPPPRDFTTMQAMDELSRERMITSVTHGRPGTAMMSFAKSLSAAEIEAVVEYVRSEFVGRTAQARAGNVPSGHPHASSSASPHGSRTPAPPVRQPDADMALGFPGELSGRVELGKVFFMNNCGTCHGKQGDGNGPRSKFIRPKPRNFLSAESRRLLNRPALYRAIALGKAGTVMPSWDKVLTAQQIADVAEFVFAQFILPAEVDATASEVESDKKKADS